MVLKSLGDNHLLTTRISGSSFLISLRASNRYTKRYLESLELSIALLADYGEDSVLLEDTKMIITVLLPQHEDRTHNYDFPKGMPFADVLKEIGDINILIQRSLMGKIKAVSLPNPSAIYSTNQVIGFEISFVGQRERREAAEAAQRRVGFVPN